MHAQAYEELLKHVLEHPAIHSALGFTGCV